VISMTTTSAPASSFDLIVIGGGPAGYVAAERAGAHGKKVLLIEREAHLGGVCLNWGCIPTKTLLNSAKVFYQATHSRELGIVVEGATFDLTAAQKRKQQVQDGLRNGIRGLMKKYKVTVVAGEARLVGRGQVAVGDVQYMGTDILIATGSRPAKPPIPGADQKHVVDSTGILGLTALPKQLVIVGGGVIGVEFACIFASVGVSVTVIELLPEITPGIDLAAAKLLRNELTAKGVQFHLGHKVARIDADAVVHVDAADKEQRSAADLVLVCVGRTPNTQGLGLEAAGVDTQRGSIVTDDRCRTNVPGIWAAGDCTSKLMLAHVASRQAEVAVDAICGGHDRMRWRAIPSVIYTSPEVACVGLNLAQAEKEGIPAQQASWPLAANGRFLAEGSSKGLCLAVFHKQTRQLLGVTLVGGSCSEMIGGFAAAIEAELRVDELTQTVFPHPTVSEAVRDAAWTLREVATAS